MTFALVVIQALEERTESSAADTSLETPPPVGATADSFTESTSEEHAGANDGTEQQEELAQDDEQKTGGAEGEVNEAANGAASPEVDPEDIEVKVCDSMQETRKSSSVSTRSVSPAVYPVCDMCCP